MRPAVNRPAPPSHGRRGAGTGRRAPPAFELSDLVGVQLDVHDADQAPPLIHHGKRQEAVLDEELARLQHGRPRRQGHHLTHHDLGHRLFRRCEQQATRRHHACQAALVVHDVQVEDAPCGGCRRRPSSASPTVWLTRICAKSWWRCLDTGSFNSRSAVFSSYISPTFVQTGTRIRSLIASLGATGSGFGTRGTPLTTTGTPPVTSPQSLSFSVAIPTLSGTTGSQMPLKSRFFPLRRA